MADLTSDLRNLATMADGLVTEGSPLPKGSSHIVKDLLLERDLLTLMDIVKRNGGKNQSSASEIVLGMSPRASIEVQSEVPTPSSFVEAMGGLCFEIRDLAQQQKLCFGGEVASSPAVVHSQVWLRTYGTATNVEIELPVPADATNPNVWTSLGSASYAPENDALIWKIKSFPGGKEYMLRAEYTLPSITSEDAAPERKASIRVKFEIPYFVVSGIQKIQILLHLVGETALVTLHDDVFLLFGSSGCSVRYLKIIEKSGYQALPCVRYITMAGEYELGLMYASFGPEYAYPQVLIDTDDCYCVILNADGGAAFPSEKTAQDCSSSDISSLKINTGSGKTEKTKVVVLLEELGHHAPFQGPAVITVGLKRPNSNDGHQSVNSSGSTREPTENSVAVTVTVNSRKTESRSSSGFPARAYRQTKVHARAQTFPLERTVKVLDG
ncbi:hypothetical protein HYC85_009457 [Camellia sinensis]|uniref:MHD domain-containing protein n=1 Tax=Camellia sinensis TaxID=4442 RepID=A0A7J7HF12_CAMSI|nr:hypothetical protein HYC85_009457 [Camellia sinensis]